MKVALVRERESPWRTGRHGLHVARMAPFLMKATGRIHRVRSARIYAHEPDSPWGREGRQYHVGLSCWCGATGFLHRKGARRDVLLHEPPDGLPICATCEGRAVGAGQQPSAWLVPPDRPLIFTPRGR